MATTTKNARPKKSASAKSQEATAMLRVGHKVVSDLFDE